MRKTNGIKIPNFFEDFGSKNHDSRQDAWLALLTLLNKDYPIQIRD